LGQFVGVKHFLPLITSNDSIGQNDNESTEGEPSPSRLPKPLYCLASFCGVFALGFGFWRLSYSDNSGGNIAFILANAAIPIGAILCLYGFNGLLRWSVGL